MFTGIIEELGKVVSLKPGTGQDGGARLVIQAKNALAAESRLQLGESIAVNGVCLTALDITDETFAADLSPETLERTSLRALLPGARVNLERAMTPGTRFGGHIVQGHVDGVGKLVKLDPLPDGNWWLTVEIPGELAPYVVMKGSIALNGISLTVAQLEDLRAASRVSVAIIPHTYDNTSLKGMQPGERINVECDVLAKHVERLLESQEWKRRKTPRRASSLTLARLREEGF